MPAGSSYSEPSVTPDASPSGSAGTNDAGTPLTDSEFWDGYWSSVRLPARLDFEDPGTRSLASAIDLLLIARRRDLGRSQGPRRLLEIGCAPGAWLTHFARRGFEVSGIDYSPKGAELTRRNLELQGIEGSVIEADVTGIDPSEDSRLDVPFDVVVSIGVIEHFDDPLPVLRAHSSLGGPGSSVIVAVPNLTGFNGWLQRKLMPDWLDLHNLETLRPARLEELGREAGLECRSLEYTGGFDPNLFEWRDRSYLGFAATRLGAAVRRLRASDHWNSRWYSAMLLAEFVVN